MPSRNLLKASKTEKRKSGINEWGNEMGKKSPAANYLYLFMR